MRILVFDTETTGKPEYGQPSESDIQPHIVQIGAEVYDLDGDEIVGALDVVIKPDGWEIPQDLVDNVHGISNEYAHEHGIPEKDAIQMLLDLRAKSDNYRVGHNVNFDDRIIRIGLKRFFDDLTAEDGNQPSDHWKAGEKFCTMYAVQKAIKFAYLPTINTIVPGVKKGKPPKLEEAYQLLFPNSGGMKMAHNGREDARHTREIYVEIMKRGWRL